MTLCRDFVETAIKRAIDVVVSLIAIVTLSPLLLTIGLFVKASSEGPLFFRDVRLGRFGKRFSMFRFRSMYMPARFSIVAKSVTVVRRTGPLDPRVTTVGRFLRRSSLDELPQFLNVLLGDMSLVGPRPISVSELEFLGSYRRLGIKPGITGLWQVSDERSGNDMVRLDAQYERHRDLWLDLKILIRTMRIAFRGMGNSSEVRISKPPGTLLHNVARFFLSQKTMEYKISPAITDLQLEYFTALASGQKLKAIWVLIRGYFSILSGLVYVGAFVLEAVRIWFRFHNKFDK